MGAKRTACFWAVLTAVLCLCILYGGKDIGLSDNGDYKRMMDTEGISYLQQQDNQYLFRRYYRMKIIGDTKTEQIRSALKTWDRTFYISIQNCFVKVSKMLNYVYNLSIDQQADTYDIFWLAILYIVLYSAAMYWILSAIPVRRIQNIIAGLILLIFCDSGYILYFNSFYGEALQFISVFLIIGSGMRWRQEPERFLWALCIFFSILLFAGSKPVNVLLSVLIGFLVCILDSIWGHKNKALYIFMGILITFCGSSYLKIPEWMNQDTLYQSVFFGILKGTDNPEEDLQELGLDTAYAPLAGTHAYLAEYPMDIQSKEFINGFYGNISRSKIVFFYLRHPIRLLEKVDTALVNSASVRPAYLANLTDIYGGTTKRWRLWSDIRARLWILYKAWFVVPILIIFSVYGACILFRGHKKTYARSAGSVLLAAGLWLNLLLPIFCNGEADLAKHMFLYCQLFDLLIFCCLSYGCQRLTLRKCFFCAVIIAVGCVRIPPVNTKQVYFGVWAGKPIKWDVMEVYSDGTADLVAHEVLTYRAFDAENGRNLWHTSSIREWLNTDFLYQCFSPAEQALLISAERRILLPEGQKTLAEGGWHPHYWAYPKKECAELWDTAWYHTVQDRVALPSVSQLDRIPISNNAGFWLATPYCSEERLVRQVNGNGFVLHGYAGQKWGVRPIIRIYRK